MTVKSADGVVTNIPLLSNATVTRLTPRSIGEIASGSYVAIIHKIDADKGDQALEVKIFPSGVPRVSVDQALDPAHSIMITQGIVAAVQGRGAGRMVTLSSGSASRTILVPAGTPTVLNEPLKPSELRAGVRLSVTNVAANGARGAGQSILIEQRDGAP